MLDARPRTKPETLVRPCGWLSIRLPFRVQVPQMAADGRLPALRQTAIRFSGVLHAKSERAARGLRVFLALLPTILAILYFCLVASDRYVSEAKFVVRTAAKPQGLAGLGTFLQMTGLTRSQDDVFSVQDFMTSRDAIQQLEKKLSVTSMYGRREGDFLARYPSIFYGSTLEQFHKYFQWLLTVSFSSATGITTLRVQAFRPEDARTVAVSLLDLGEQMVNRMNERIQNDAVRVAADEVSRNEQRLITAQVAITNYRNRELMIDPARSSVILSELTARLDSDLTQTKTELTEMMAASPNGPQIGVLQRRIAALEAQIPQERTRISDPSTGLANKLAEYEKLVLDREFAKQALTAASSALDAARAEARRQQLYLERVVEPSEPDYPTMPQRLRMIATSFGLNVLGLLVGWLIFSGVKEHASALD
jgi:capsular polysaccharide transport system permease protein